VATPARYCLEVHAARDWPAPLTWVRHPTHGEELQSHAFADKYFVYKLRGARLRHEQADLADPRFAPLLGNPDFALDPTDPRFAKAAGVASAAAAAAAAARRGAAPARAAPASPDTRPPSDLGTAGAGSY